MDQIRLLTRTFFARLFESDLMPEGLPQVQLVLWGALLAAMPTIGYPMIVRRAFDSDRVMLITLTMVAIGVVSLIDPRCSAPCSWRGPSSLGSSRATCSRRACRRSSS